jgi:hypothetical protein
MWKLVGKGTAWGLGLGLMVGTAMAGAPGALVGGTFGLTLGAGLMALFVVGGALSSRYPWNARRLSFDCPHSRRHVDAVMLQNADSRRVFEVDSCSVFDPPRNVRCAKRCIDDLNGCADPAARGLG